MSSVEACSTILPISMKMHSWLARRAWPMLWVTITIVYFSPQAVDQVLDPLDPFGVEGRAGLVHQDHSRFQRQQPGDAQLLLLFERQVRGPAAQPVLHFVPKLHVAQRRFDHFVALPAGELAARRVRPDAEQHVLVDRDRQRIGPLEDHAHRFAQRAQRDVGVVDVLAEDGDFAGGGDVAVALVDAVEAAQQRGLAAARGADQRRDDARLDVDRDVLEGLEIAVPEVEPPGLDGVGRRWSVFRLRRAQPCSLVRSRSGCLTLTRNLPSRSARSAGSSRRVKMVSVSPASISREALKKAVRSASRRACCTRFVTSTIVISFFNSRKCLRSASW